MNGWQTGHYTNSFTAHAGLRPRARAPAAAGSSKWDCVVVVPSRLECVIYGICRYMYCMLYPCVYIVNRKATEFLSACRAFLSPHFTSFSERACGRSAALCFDGCGSTTKRSRNPPASRGLFSRSRRSFDLLPFNVLSIIQMYSLISNNSSILLYLFYCSLSPIRQHDIHIIDSIPN